MNGGLPEPSTLADVLGALVPFAALVIAILALRWGAPAVLVIDEDEPVYGDTTRFGEGRAVKMSTRHQESDHG